MCIYSSNGTVLKPKETETELVDVSLSTNTEDIELNSTTINMYSMYINYKVSLCIEIKTKDILQNYKKQTIHM